MTKRMLIDAAHAEETRVAVIDGGQIEELDFEIASKRQLRGNIYLAKVIRVEPSLQAAFVEYGGNRHGFLAFNEIHPDYFQIPHADREALLREAADDSHDDEPGEDGEEVEALGRAEDDDDAIEQELERRRRRLMRRYKIQEVIRRRQIMLIQVVKEERGNKGAALTTYLSLAGRYCVLMPNTARGGGISRKITNAADRKRLKSAANSLDVPQGMGLIVRTAGAARTKSEIKRDYEYLLRMWENIRETTLKSIAPALIYAEEDLVKRAVRDMFDKEFDSIQVEGEAGWREARDFMRMIMPSQAKKVIHYKDPTPLFVRHRVEDQIAQIHSPIVQLRSGGYLVINQTEALVAIDVNSGRSTRERNIEQTALKTNVEAAEEAARQLRLRDLAGLIVIDFIDMDESKNNRAVEKVLKDCLKEDRARVQMGKISAFGLMEISRQRRRMGVLEGSTHVCEHCQGAGRIRSVESSALSALRAVEIEAVKGGGGAVILKLPTDVGLYVLNCKRAYLTRLEESHGLAVTVAVDDKLAHAEQEIERTETVEGGGQPLNLEPPKVAFSADEPNIDEDADDEEPAPTRGRGQVVEVLDGDDDIEDVADSADGEARSAPDETERGDSDRGDSERGRGRRRRRRGGRGRDDAEVEIDAAAAIVSDDTGDEEDDDGLRTIDGVQETEEEAQRRRRRRRGRRGGRRMREEGEGPDVYAWRHAHPTPPHADRGQDPYVWRDPQVGRGFDEPRRRVEAPNPVVSAPESVPVSAPQETLTTTTPMPGPQVEAAPGADPYVWREDADPVVADAPEAASAEAPVGATPEASSPDVEAEPVAVAKPKRVRAPRSRAKKPATETPLVLDAPEPEALGETAASPATVEPMSVDSGPVEPTPVEPLLREPVLAADPAIEPLSSAAESGTDAPLIAAQIAPPAPVESEAQRLVEPEPELEPQPEPVAVAPVARAPDPAEITAPPAAPKRGWWRR